MLWRKDITTLTCDAIINAESVPYGAASGVTTPIISNNKAGQYSRKGCRQIVQLQAHPSLARQRTATMTIVPVSWALSTATSPLQRRQRNTAERLMNFTERLRHSFTYLINKKQTLLPDQDNDYLESSSASWNQLSWGPTKIVTTKSQTNAFNMQHAKNLRRD